MQLILEIASGAAAFLFLYFFSTTRLTIIVNRYLSPENSETSHIYWIYRNKWLIRLTDRKALISAILLFQYDKLVDRVIAQLQRLELKNRTVVQASCAFGDITPRLVEECTRQGAGEIVVTDIIENELLHVKAKLGSSQKYCKFVRQNVLNMNYPDESVDVVVMFFLLHELPGQHKQAALREVSRILKPGGTLIIGEFHKPAPILLKTLGWLYFKTFEPYALPIWAEANPSGMLQDDVKTGWKIRKETFLFGNFQVLAAQKPGRPAATNT